ncbi:MAG: hypothetical protein KME10_02850 [Plectolyngbya sp. WJT66-NPBG17]|nr:hypothetical protein [Plectolyngbya sp. WJT66-NPBG17]
MNVRRGERQKPKPSDRVTLPNPSGSCDAPLLTEVADRFRLVMPYNTARTVDRITTDCGHQVRFSVALLPQGTPPYFEEFKSCSLFFCS